MRILLPPSETKSEGSLRRTLAFPDLLAPELTPARRAIAEHLVTFCARPTARVRNAIGTTARQDEELARNAQLLSAPTAPAHEIYSGVLFDALDVQSLTAAASKRAQERVLVQSALFGVLRFGDAIPAYRLSADSTLPRIGKPSTYWKSRVGSVLDAIADAELIVDMRSGAYSTFWKPSRDHVVVNVMQERNGKKVAVSHFNKATKGLLTRELLQTAKHWTSPEQVTSTLATAGFDVDLMQQRNGAQHLIVTID